MRSTQEVMPILDGNELCAGRVGKEFHFLLCIGNGIHRILCTLVTLSEDPITQIVADHLRATT